MKSKFYLMVNNKPLCIMDIVATFNSPSDATNVCKLLNKQLKELGDTIHEYGVTDNPMNWKGPTF